MRTQKPLLKDRSASDEPDTPPDDSSGTSSVRQEDLTERMRLAAAREEHMREVADLNARMQRAMVGMHHRVKSDLQVVSALIEMAVGDSGQGVPPEVVRQLGHHVNGLAEIHDLLAEQCSAGGGSETISVRAVFARLAPLLQSTAPTRRIRTVVDETRVPTRQAGALVMVVNELVANAMEHGDGEVAVSLTSLGHNVTLQVEDDGHGFPRGLNYRDPLNKGLELVTNLTRIDLGGSAQFGNRRRGGARIVIKFPLAAALGAVAAQTERT